MLAGLFGMNVDLPGDPHAPYTFWLIIGASIVSAFGLGFYFLKKR
jgi:Mg2+ and Co2+ transporter CorA